MFTVDLATDRRSSYDISRYMNFEHDWYNALNSKFIHQLIKLPTVGYHTVKTEEGRPDLLSNSIYDSTEYWWMLLIYNDKVCPIDIKVGDIIKYPTLSSIQSLYVNITTSSL